MTTNQNKIFITGATGDIGAQLISILRSTNHPIRVLCRRQAQYDDFTSRNIEASLGNFTDPSEKLSKLMSGCHTLFLNGPAAEDMVSQLNGAIDAAIDAGIKYIVKISASDTEVGENVPWAKAHSITDQYLTKKADEAGVQWTIMAPTAFMQNLMMSKDAVKRGFLPQCAGKGKIGWIDTADIASSCAAVLRSGPSKHARQTYKIMGPAMITFDDIAAALSKAVGYKVKYIDLPPWLFKQILMRAGGLDEFMANGLLVQFDEVVRLGLAEEPLNDDVERLTGKKPTSIEEWTERNKEAFRGQKSPIGLVAGLVGVGVVAAGAYVLWQ